MMETRSRAAVSRARLPPPSTFCSLPKEIHARILHFIICTDTLLAVACVSSSFQPLAVSQRWQRLDFSSSHTGHSANRERIATMLSEVEAEKWESVRAVRLPATPETAESMMDIFRMLGDRLTRIEFSRFFSYSGCGCCRKHSVKQQKMLDVLLFESDITLPSLTHVALHYDSNCHYDFLQLLCTRAPNLIDLDVDLDKAVPRDCDELANPAGVKMVGPTRLRSILVTSSYPNQAGLDAITYLVNSSPDLRRFIVRYWPNSHPAFCDDYEGDTSDPNDATDSLIPDGSALRQLRNSLSEHTELQSLYWPTDTILRDEVLDDNPSGLQSLVTLVVRCKWTDTFEWRYRLPKLERLFLDNCDQPWHLFGESIYESAPSFAVQILLHFCDFADFLRYYPRLHILHTIQEHSDVVDFDIFDQLDVRAGQSFGQVGSIRHDEDELICARLLIDFEEVEDREWRKEEMEIDAAGVEIEEAEIPDEEYLIGGTSTSLRYTARDGTMRERVYEKRAESVREVLCDFKGLPVPIEVVQAMWGLEGLSGEPWERRGVSAGERAWKVLTDWYERMVQGEDFVEMGQLSSDEDYDQSEDEHDWSQSQCTQYTQ